MAFIAGTVIQLGSLLVLRLVNALQLHLHLLGQIRDGRALSLLRHLLTALHTEVWVILCFYFCIHYRAHRPWKWRAALARFLTA